MPSRPFELIALTPAGAGDPGIALAAGRAGATGILDLTLVRDAAATRPVLEGLARHGRGSLGVLLDAGRPELLADLAADLPDAARTVILTAAPMEALREPIRALKAGGRRVLVQVVSREEADAATAAGADGLVAKGHEAGGRVGEETAFILLQRLAARSGLPVFAHGGIGMHTIAAAYVAGAAGAVLDSQLLLARESPLPRPVRRALERMDGSETAVVGGEIGDAWRFYDRPGLRPVETLRATARGLCGAGAGAAWRRALRDAAGWADPRLHAMPLGQDAAFAAPLARRFVTVAGILDALRGSIETHVRAARSLRPLDQDAPLARSHGTRFPIVQGPMTRVSDTAPFALSVAEGGGLPFLALALMRAPEVETLLQETTRRLGERPWGVGILGFVPLELRQEQLEVVRRVRPRFALIAGGRPDQARALEQDGIATYLHVPSPGLLKLFLEGGARRFVFEGRECGGHVGPRSSFVLWDTMIDTILENLPAGEIPSCHVLFAAGIHDALSASMVAALAAPLAEKGARVGVLLGTAYLFTREAVASGAIVEGFQQEAVRCDRTVLLETGPGHSTRCTDSEFTRMFEEERRRLTAEGRPAEEIRNALEALNLGRLRVASKGVDRNPGFGRDPEAPKLLDLTPEEQRVKGMFMIGQVAALRNQTCAIEELHRDVAVGGSARLAALEEPRLRVEAVREERPSDVAIVGMSCLLPKAPDLRVYWENILRKVDAITEVPPDRFDWRLYFDADPKVRDRIYSKWGGFIDDVPFDPLLFGMPPNSLPSIEPIHLLTLLAARAALRDAGYLTRPFARERTSVILGAGGGISDLGNLYAFRSTLPSFIKDPPERLLSRLPEWTEDSFPGVLMNVAAGRVANRFDLGGVNCTVDAACASSLAALYMAVRELDAKSSDLVLAGGIDTAQNPFMFLCFSKTHAHAAGGRCRTFDENADGIVISEGVALLALKRLEDAERDGDRVYAVIKAMAGSSDGRDKGLTAPRPEGQARALVRAYARAGFSPATVGLAEAHGTGTVAGDQAEVTTLRRVFEAAGAAPRECALGSVKSMIGHTKCTAGVAGMAKIALALHHRALPPTLHVTKPNARAGAADGPFYVNTELRPWLRHPDGRPRRACVSAFGFGGTNFHAVLEEYRDPARADETSLLDRWSEELFVFRGRDRGEIAAALARLETDLAAGAAPDLSDLAFTMWQTAREREDAQACLAIVASAETLPARLAAARVRLAMPAGGAGAGPAGASAAGPEPPGVFFADTPLGRDGKVALLFPGQGSQYVNMLRDLALHFEEARGAFEEADRALAAPGTVPLSRRIFPPPAFSPEEERAQQQALTATDVAQPALGAAGLAVLRLLAACGVRPDMTAGHSYGEYVALCAAGGLDAAALPGLSQARGRSILEAARDDLGTMAAVPAGPDEVGDLLRPLDEVWIANLNAPRQTVISGTRAGIERAVALLKERGLEARPIPVACAFHSPVVAPARDRLAAVLAAIEFRAPSAEAFSNSTASPYPADPKGIAALLADHLVRPVRFTEEILAMHARGARVFVEAGPKNVLTGLTQQILKDRPHVAVAADVSGRSGLGQFLGLLGTLAAHGVAVDLDRLFRGRELRELDLASLAETTRPQAPSPTTWLVNGGSARPMSQAKRLFEPMELPVAAAAAPAVPAPASAVLAPAPAMEAPAVRAPAMAAPMPAAPALAAASPDPAVSDPALAVVQQFQQMMTRFLDTQRAVMQAYLAGGTPAGTQPPAVAFEAAVPAFVPAIPLTAAVTAVASAAGVVAERVETIPVVSEATPTPAVALVGAATSPVENVRAEELTRRLLAIVGERTGYPPDMIGLDLDIEADLGIDSIKRVEILGAFQRACPPEAQQRLQDAMEQMSRVRTLRAIVARATPPAAPVAVAASAAVTAPPVENVRAEELTRRLLAIVGERTGYPPDMIGLDLDIEADLGIDSIKRVEILGAFQRACPAEAQKRLQDAMEQMSRVRTLRAIVTQAAPAQAAPVQAAPSVENIRAGAQVAASATVAAPVENVRAETEDGAPAHAAASAGGTAAVPRFLTRVVQAPLDGDTTLPFTDRTWLLTDDGLGVAAALAAEIESRGGRAVVIPATGDLEALVVEARRGHGPIGALLHLAPLGTDAAGTAEAAGMPGTAWKEAVERDLGGLFRLARIVGPDLQAGGGGLLLAAVGLDGTLGFGPANGALPRPWQGALAGFIKTLAVEWPAVRCRVLDLGTPSGAGAARDAAPGATDSAAPSERATRLLEEIAAIGTPDVEVGFSGGRRLVFRPRRTEIEADLAPQTAPDGSWVFLITGGARGITAEATLGIAERWRPTLVLVGRSPLPPEREAAATAGLAGMAEIRPVLLEEMRRAGAAPTPAAVEAAARRLLQEREMRACLAALRATGARVEYVRADVRDQAALGAVVANVYRDHGRLDAVIHGAGIIEDRKFEDKTAESFDRVFGTKVDGALALARAVRPDSLKLFAFFSSVAGRYGNRGQCDYAAANDAVNKLAADLDRRWPARVVSLNWGPWMKTGMASPEVQRQFRERGVALVPPDGGRRAFVQEIERGAKGEVEVILGDGPWRPFAEAAEAAAAGSAVVAAGTRAAGTVSAATVVTAAPVVTAAQAPATPRAAIVALHEELPLLNGARLKASAGGAVELTRLFDPAHDLYLLDHRLDGRPVLPLAVAMELTAEVVRRGWPEMEIAALLDFRLLQGVVLENGPRALRVLARPAQQPEQESLGLAVDVSIVDPERGRPFYQGTVLLADRLPEPPARHLAPLRDARPFPMSLKDAYDEWLFHGPLFHGIRSVEGIDDDGISGTVEPSQPGRCVRDAAGTEWIIDPVVVDSAFQLGILHSRARFDMTPLPARLRSFRRFAPLAGGPIRCEYRSAPRAGGHVLDIQIAFLDGAGRLLGLLEDMELSCSRELNRLAVKTRGEA